MTRLIQCITPANWNALETASTVAGSILGVRNEVHQQSRLCGMEAGLQEPGEWALGLGSNQAREREGALRGVYKGGGGRWVGL